jgi:hypothetical protein
LAQQKQASWRLSRSFWRFAGIRAIGVSAAQSVTNPGLILCLPLWSASPSGADSAKRKSQIRKSKIQNKKQISITLNSKQLALAVLYLRFVVWCLFDIWDFDIGISNEVSLR